METGDYLKFVLALVFVLGLIGVLALLVRRFGFGMSTLQSLEPVRQHLIISQHRNRTTVQCCIKGQNVHIIAQLYPVCLAIIQPDYRHRDIRYLAGIAQTEIT